METVRNRIDSVRRDAGITQQQMADALLVPFRTYQEWTSTKKDLKFLSIQGLCGYAMFGVNLNWLITGQGPKYIEEAEPIRLRPRPVQAARTAVAESTPYPRTEFHDTPGGPVEMKIYGEEVIEPQPSAEGEGTTQLEPSEGMIEMEEIGWDTFINLANIAGESFKYAVKMAVAQTPGLMHQVQWAKRQRATGGQKTGSGGEP